MTRESFWYRAKVALGTSLLFLVAYGGSNAYTATLPNVPSFFFEWERAIPFVPLLILPYMSIDLFFVAAPFVCRTDREVTTFAKRICFAIVVAVACFLVWPLKFSFERPRTGGLMGAFFDWFRTMDAPFNQFPSLHIALSWLLLDVYLRRGSHPVKAAVVTWFGLIIASTVLTFQHHVIDVAGGAVLGLITVNLFRNEREEAPSAAIPESPPITRSAAS